ncbi:MAG: hypothetical protein VCF24_17335 [Candidatus Latescibacterota bacterium]
MILNDTLLDEFATDIWMREGSRGGIRLVPSVGDSMSFYLDEAGGQAISNVPSASLFDQVPFDVRPWVRYRLSLQLWMVVSHPRSPIPWSSATLKLNHPASEPSQPSTT